MDGQAWAAGLQIGTVYSLIGLGFICAYSGTRCVNFAQGEFSMLGGLLTAVLLPTFHSQLWIASLAAFLLTIVVGVLTYLIVVYWLQEHPLLSILGTIGVSLLLRGMVALQWGRDVYSLPNFSEAPYIRILTLALPTQALWMAGAMIAMLLLVVSFLRGTLEGRAFSACSISPSGAILCGVSPLIVGMTAFALAAGVGAVAGIVVTPVTFVSYDTGLSLSLRGFSSAAVGGMRSFPLTVLGGLGLGLLESLSMRYISGSYKEVVVFCFLTLVLLLNARRLNATLAEEAG